MLGFHEHPNYWSGLEKPPTIVQPAGQQRHCTRHQQRTCTSSPHRLLVATRRLLFAWVVRQLELSIAKSAFQVRLQYIHCQQALSE